MGFSIFTTGAAFWRRSFDGPVDEALRAVLAGGDPAWLGWLGVGLGLGCPGGLVVTRFNGPFHPPISAHLYTAVLGVWLLTGS